MGVQFSEDVRNAMLDAIEDTIGPAPVIELRTGAKPANCAAASSGDLLARAAVPSDWMAAAASGSKAKAGTWSLDGVAAGDIGHFRIFEAGSPDVCKAQGSVTAQGGGGDMTITGASVTIAIGQAVTVDTFTLTAGNG